MRRIHVIGPAVAALFAAACGANAKHATAPERAAQQAEEDKQEAQEEARKAHDEANRERREAQEATQAERGAERNAQWASQRAALAQAQAIREGQASPATRAGAAEAQGDDVARTAVLFARDSVDLSADARTKLDQIASTARARGRGYAVIVEGYTDDTGPEATNRQLSERRAQEAAGYLESQGVPRERIACKALGSLHPVSQEGTDRGRALNRRVEVVVERTGSPTSR